MDPPIDNVADAPGEMRRNGENTGRAKMLGKQRVAKQTQQQGDSTYAKYYMPPILGHGIPKTQERYRCCA
jgi:hypothetical protein